MGPDELSPPERRLWDAFPTAGQVDLRAGDPAADDPVGGAAWGPERVVRAEVVAALLLGARDGESGHTAAVQLTGARITGRLALDHADVQHHLRLQDCSFEESADLYGARTRQLSFNGSHLPGLLASHLWAEGSLRFTGCTTSGKIRLVATRIAGTLILNGARLHDPGGEALNATRLQVDNDILMRDDFSAQGTVVLRSARIGGSLDLRTARLDAGSGEAALDAARVQVDGDFSAYRLSATGRLGLRNATVAGATFLRSASLDNPEGRTLDAPGMHVGSDVVLDKHFRSHGQIRLADATVGGRLVMSGATLRAEADEAALDAYGIQIGADAVLDHVTATGLVRLSGAQITGRIEADGSRISGHTPGATALSLRRTTAREADMRTTRLDGALDMRYSALGVLHDAAATWPPRVRLDGAVYEQLHDPLSAAERLPWLSRGDSAYVPQPYEQLAAVYRHLGHEDDARRVLLAKQRARRRQLPWYARVWGAVQDAVVGYGYRPERAVAWLAGLLALGSLLFWAKEPQPLEPGKKIEFNPFVYTLDTLLPVVDFGQGNAFAPGGGAQWVAYLLAAAGWILATAVAAGAARALNRA
ncbi:hypothetical protein DMB38_06080 [Streptomyces sp. WAC 06738]|uniref:hypothetical protein n=1 Tax=Streptomyces sp. WAC 06738 TaxID=2203210 RepID=UPI000F71B42F|nr:hypothetical protein [Streptomyces sp. WAC 06738]AZM45451.1 hypothetical protein DMB38_06080 [Streptomyces sp. WAC 06738]